MLNDDLTYGQRPTTSYMKKLIDRGEYLKAFDLGARLLQEPLDDRLEAIKLHALCLSKLGMHEEAIAKLEDVRRLFLNSDSDMHALLGSFYKRLWLEQKERDSDSAKKVLSKSFSEYMHARELGGDYWCAINAATLASLLGREKEADRFAEEVLEECWDEYNRHGTSSSFWIPASLGEANLVKGDYSAACRWYKAARSHIGSKFGWIASTRANAELLLDSLSPAEDIRLKVLESIPRVRIALFSGHRLDQPGRLSPRFPSESSAKVMQKLKKELIKLKLDFGIASAADGADILFHECLQGMGKRTIVVLPSPVEHFRKKIAASAGDEWTLRFDQVIDKADYLEISSTSRFDSEAEDIYSLCTDFMIGSAIDIAESFDADLVPVVVWDGRTHNRKGGTAYAVSRLRKLGYPTHDISIPIHVKSDRNDRPLTPEGEFSYEEMGIYEPRSRPIVVFTTGMSEGSEEDNASRLSSLAGMVLEICKTNSIDILSSGFLPGELYLILESTESLNELIRTYRTELPRSSYHSLVLHIGMVIRVESSLSNLRDQYCRELDEALALAMSLHFPVDVCTMQVKSLISISSEDGSHYGYRGKFETRGGTSLRIFTIT